MPTLFIPFIGSGFDVKAENRHPATLPNFEFKYIKRFPKEFEQYYNDNFSFRNYLIMLNGFVKYYVLRSPSSNRVVIGNDGWLFYTGDRNMDITKGSRKLSENELKKILSNQLAIQEYYKKLGIDYYLMITPSKTSIYYNFIKGNEFESSPYTLMDQIYDYLKENSNIKVVELKDNLLQSKHESRVYFKADTHWNPKGMFIGYTNLINTISESTTISEPIDVEWKKDYFDVEMYKMMGIDNFFNNKYGEIYKNSTLRKRDSYLLNEGELYNNIKHNSYSYYLNNYINKNKQKKVLFYHDSFMAISNAQQLISEHFGQTLFAWKPEQVANWALLYRPDIVVYETTERFSDVRLLQNIDARFIFPVLVDHKANIESAIIKDGKILVKVKNISNDDWSEGKQVRLGIFNENGEDTSIRLYISKDMQVKPNESYVFSTDADIITSSIGKNIMFQMLEEGITYFGDKAPFEIE
jgi:hypothetical protein